MAVVAIVAALLRGPTCVLADCTKPRVGLGTRCSPAVGVCCNPGLVCMQQLAVAWKRFATTIGQFPTDLQSGNPAVTQCRRPVYTTGQFTGRRRSLLAHDAAGEDSALDGDEDHAAEFTPGINSSAEHIEVPASRKLLQATTPTPIVDGVCGVGYLAARHNKALSSARACTSNDQCPQGQACWNTVGDGPQICSQSFYSTPADVSDFCQAGASCEARLAVTICYPHQPETCYLKQERFVGYYGGDPAWFNGKTPSSVAAVDGIPYNTFPTGTKLSVRWTGKIVPLVNGTYTFEHVADDASDVYVNGVNVLRNAGSSLASPAFGSVNLLAGTTYNLTILYGNDVGVAFVSSRWAGPDNYFQTSMQSILVCSDCPQGLSCDGKCYFSQQWFSGYHNGDLSFFAAAAPYVNVSTATTQLSYTSPELLVRSPPPESVAWTGLIKVGASGSHIFRLTSDDDSYLFINNRLVLTAGVATGTQQSGVIDLDSAATYWVAVFWGNRAYTGSITLQWANLQTQPPDFSSDFRSILACPSLVGCPASFQMTPDQQCAPAAANPCLPGNYSSSGGAPCSVCKAGTFAPLPASTMCAACQSGTYSAKGAGACTRVPFVYGACYLDYPEPNRVLPTLLTGPARNMTVAACVALARSGGFPYAGLQNGDSCWGGPALPAAAAGQPGSALFPALCDVLCTGSGGNRCGGLYANSIYPVPALSANGSAAYISGGCYADSVASRVLSKSLYSGADMTVGLCISLALQGGYRYAGLQAASQCWAGGALPASLRPANCTADCSGGDGNICGGNLALNIYTVG